MGGWLHYGGPHLFSGRNDQEWRKHHLHAFKQQLRVDILCRTVCGNSRNQLLRAWAFIWNRNIGPRSNLRIASLFQRVGRGIRVVRQSQDIPKPWRVPLDFNGHVWDVGHCCVWFRSI